MTIILEVVYMQSLQIIDILGATASFCLQSTLLRQQGNCEAQRSVLDDHMAEINVTIGYLYMFATGPSKHDTDMHACHTQSHRAADKCTRADLDEAAGNVATSLTKSCRHHKAA